MLVIKQPVNQFAFHLSLIFFKAPLFSLKTVLKIDQIMKRVYIIEYRVIDNLRKKYEIIICVLTVNIMIHSISKTFMSEYQIW